MNSARKTRMIYVLALGIGILLASVFILFAFVANTKQFRVPVEVMAGDYPNDKEFKLGGYVVDNSVVRDENTAVATFVVTDKTEETPGGKEVTVSYDQQKFGVLPPLFRDGQWAVLTGSYQNDVFTANHVMAKHDENYVSPSATGDQLKKRIENARQFREESQAFIDASQNSQNN